MEIKEIVTQIVGIIAMFFSVFSFQMNTHKKIMLMQIGATLFFGIQYGLLGAVTGMVLDFVAIVRDVVFYYQDKKWAAHKAWPYVFAIIFIIAGIITYENPTSLLMTAAMALNTFTFSFTKPVLVRSTILISSPLVLAYNIFNFSFGGIINEVFVFISSIVGMLRYDIKWNKKEK